MRRFSSLSQNTVARQHSSIHRSPEKVSFQRTVIGLYLSGVTLLGIIVILFFSGRLVVAGVPSSIILDVLGDDAARSAYFSGDKAELHDRIKQLNVKRQLKEFYQPHFRDEAELDRHVSQILYDRTGYLDTAYGVNQQGRLVLRNTLNP